MDHATASLDAILRSDDYVRVADVPLFDAHDEFDGEGNLIRRFDRKRLESVCQHNNKRAEKTGNLATVGPGHTIQNAPETEQPPVWGFAANWKVKPFGKDKTPTIHADWYVKKTVEDHKGNELDGVKAIKSMPHRSIELWTVDPDGKTIPGYVDHVAVLRQTPRRDLGFIAYAKGKQVTMPASRPLYGSPARTRGLSAAERGRKLFYSMETPHMDPELQADAMAPDDDFISKVRDALKAISPKLAAMIEEPAAPDAGLEPPMDAPGGEPPLPGGLDAPGGDAPLPPDDKGGKPLNFAKMDQRSLANYLTHFQKQVADLQGKVKAAETARTQEKLNFSKADAEKRVDGLQQAGYILDREREVLNFSKLPLDGDARDGHEHYIRSTHRQGFGSALPPAGMLNVGDSPRTGSINYSKAAVEAATAYCAEKGLTSTADYNEALLKFSKK